MDQATKDKIIADLHAKISMGQIAKKYRVSRGSVAGLKDRAGLTPIAQSHPRTLHLRVTHQQFAFCKRNESTNLIREIIDALRAKNEALHVRS